MARIYFQEWDECSDYECGCGECGAWRTITLRRCTWHEYTVCKDRCDFCHNTGWTRVLPAYRGPYGSFFLDRVRHWRQHGHMEWMREAGLDVSPYAGIWESQPLEADPEFMGLLLEHARAIREHRLPSYLVRST